MYNYEIVEIKVWKFEYGIIISMVTLFIGLILAAIHVLYVFFCTPKNYLLNPTAAKKPTIIAECRPPPTISQPAPRKRRHRPSQDPQQQKPQNDNKFFYIDTTTSTQKQHQTLQTNPPNFDEEFLDRLKQDIRYYPKQTAKTEELRREAFVPHIHGRITSCSRKAVPKMKNVRFEDDENIDSFNSDASEDLTTTIAGETKTKEGDAKIPDTVFTKFMTKYLEAKEIEEDAQLRDGVVPIPIKENDTIYRTFKNVKNNF